MPTAFKLQQQHATPRHSDATSLVTVVRAHRPEHGTSTTSF